MDCRLSNAWFHDPDSVSLCTGEALGALDLEPGDSLHLAEADLRDAFYHLELPLALRNYFCLKSLRAEELGLRQVAGVPVQGRPDGLELGNVVVSRTTLPTR